jgi:hypothetical protein
MKSSGSLRYIKDQHLLEMILDYSSSAEAAESRSTLMETEFTTTHWVIAVSNFMSQYSAIKDYQRARRGNSIIFNDEQFANSMIDSNYIMLEKQLNNIPHTPVILTGAELRQIRNKLMPYLVRRQALIVNTIKFMRQTKNKGSQLKAYMADH